VETYLPRLPTLGEGKPRRLVFPGYIFARTDEDTDDLLRIRSAPGISYVLPRGGPPAYLPESAIEMLRMREAASPPPLSRGERVVILSEPFRSLEAVFDRRLSAAGRVRVLLELVHRVVALDLHEAELQRANA